MKREKNKLKMFAVIDLWNINETSLLLIALPCQFIWVAVDCYQS